MIEAFFWMMLNVHHEARGESLIGQKAVNHVVINRVQASGKSFKNEITKKYQFSWLNKRKERQYAYFLEKSFKIAVKKALTGDFKDLKKFKKYKKSAKSVILSFIEKDPTFGCNHYYNPRNAAPKWSATGYKISIGNHNFHKLSYGNYKQKKIHYAILGFQKCVKTDTYNKCSYIIGGI